MDILSYRMGQSSAGGGGEAVLINKSVTANGTYNASADSADGYKKVEVSVPASAVDTGTKSITSNGNGQDVVGYAAVDVDVPNSYSAGDEGKVVSDGALVSQGSDTVTSNGTVDTTLINSLTVNVSGFTADQVALGGMTGDLVVAGSGQIPGSRFENQTGITSFSAVNVTRCGAACFKGCSSLTSVHLPNYNYVYQSNVFNGCSSLVKLALPSAGNVGSPYGFDGSFCYGCTNLEEFDAGKARGFANTHFFNCGKLNVIVLRYSGIVSIGNINSFQGTPFASGGTGGHIYIPKALYDHLGDNSSSDYKAASNWSTLDGYGTITWHAIEGSYYETHYADGTVIS